LSFSRTSACLYRNARSVVSFYALAYVMVILLGMQKTYIGIL